MNKNSITNHRTFDFSKTDVIKPPIDEIKDNHKVFKYTKVIVNSADRDIINYPNPNNYTVDIVDTIENIVSAEIVMHDIPFTEYLINENNNKIYLNNAEVLLNHGDYSKIDLAGELQNNINAVPGNNFEVVYSSRLDNFSFKNLNQVPFTLKFDSYIYKLLGYDKDTEYTSDNTSYTISAINRCDFNANKYICIYIETLTLNSSIDSNIHKSSLLVYRNEMSINSRSATYNIIKNYNPIISQLARIQIKAYDAYGNPYNFHNQDHRIDILFTSRKISLGYLSYV